MLGEDVGVGLDEADGVGHGMAKAPSRGSGRGLRGQVGGLMFAVSRGRGVIRR
jgi:hypothetical protein